MTHSKYQEGDKVRYTGSYDDVTEVVTIETVDDDDQDDVIYYLSNGCWCCEDQIIGFA